jgi:aconitate hydratase
MDIKKFVDTLVINGNDFYFYNISKCEQEEINIRKLPFSIRILLENVIRNYDNKYIKDEHVKNLLSWKSKDIRNKEIPYKPVRILMQDFTGVPAVVDLASMREASKALNLNPSKINPLITVDLIVDHSVQVDYYGTDVSLDKNVQLEYQRNIERYKLL